MLARLVADMLDVDFVLVCLTDGTHHEPVAAYGLEDMNAAAAASSALIGQLLGAAGPLAIEDARTFVVDGAPDGPASGLRGFIGGAEAFDGSSLKVVLWAATREPRRFSSWTLERLREFVHLAGRIAGRGAAAASQSEDLALDRLTGLPERHRLVTVLMEQMERARASSSRVGLMIANLDYFKEFNAVHGQELGDRVLRTVAARMTAAVGHRGIVARMAGDEFGVVLTELCTPDEMMGLADDLIAVTHSATGREGVSTAVSVGVAVFPEDAVDCASMFAAADGALIRAKEAGRGIALRHDAGHGITGAGMIVREAMRQALDRDEIVAYYQPQVALDPLRIVGFEALVRWERQGFDTVLPGEFQAALSDGILARAISDRILDQVTSDIEAWTREGLDFGSVSVNAAAVELRRDRYDLRIADLLKRKSIDPGRLHVEITETALIGPDGAELRDLISRLALLGIEVSLDDFGTGYASLTHLRKLAVSEIKIDRTFIRDLVESPADAAIVKALIDLGRHLGMRVVAEGVESVETHRFLVDLGCEYGQGYLFGRPQPAERTLQILRDRHARGEKTGW